MSNVEDELRRHLESLDPINQEVYHKIFRKLAEQEGNGARMRDLMNIMPEDPSFNGGMVLAACRWLKERGHVKATVNRMGETIEVDIEDDVRSVNNTYIIPTEELWGYLINHYG